MAVLTGTVNSSIRSLWNRLNLAMILHCLPSEIDDESRYDVEAITIVLAMREEVRKKKEEEGGT